MKKLISILAVCLVAIIATAANKFTPQAEKAASVGLHANWATGGVAPDAATVSAQLRVKLVNDDDATNTKEYMSGEISFNGLREDRSIAPVGGGGNMTYKQVTLTYLKMVADARANP